MLFAFHYAILRATLSATLMFRLRRAAFLRLAVILRFDFACHACRFAADAVFTPRYDVDSDIYMLAAAAFFMRYLPLRFCRLLFQLMMPRGAARRFFATLIDFRHYFLIDYAFHVFHFRLLRYADVFFRFRHYAAFVIFMPHAYAVISIFDAISLFRCLFDIFITLSLFAMPKELCC